MRASPAWIFVLGSLGCAEVLGLDGYEETTSSSVATVGVGGHAGSTGAANGGAAGAGGSGPCGAYCALVKSHMPLGYWRLGEASGETKANDEMGEYPGTYAPGTGILKLAQPSLTNEANTSAAIQNGEQGTATVRVDNVPYFAGKTHFTLEVWVKPLDLQYAAMIEQHQLQATGVLQQGYVMTYDMPGVFRFGRILDDEFDTVQVDVPMVAEAYHVVGTYDGNEMCIYVNAVPGPCVVSLLSLVAIDRPLVMGRAMSNGVLDEVAVYNEALTQAQIEEHYRSGRLGP